MWRDLLQAVIELIYPPRQQCPLCGAQSKDESLCLDCGELLAGYAGEAVCYICGGFMGDHWGRAAGGSPGAALSRQGYGDRLICPICRAEARPFELARAVAPFEGPVREAVHRLKYKGMKALASPLGELMAGVALRESAFADADVLVPVPLHPRRERERGYNQSLLLARAAGELLQLPVLERAVMKTRETPSQTVLSGRERRQNLLQAFAVAEPGLIKGKIVTVVDDVFTTGSTVSILSQLLRQAGAPGVLVLTLAGTRQSVKK